MPFAKYTILIIFLTSLLGCQTLDKKKQATALEDTLRQYAATVRWGALDQARQFHENPGALTQSRIPKDVRVTNYEVIQGPTLVSEDKALQTAVIQYVFESRQVVKEIQHQQVWQYDESTKVWSQHSPMPEFK